VTDDKSGLSIEKEVPVMERGGLESERLVRG